MDAPDGSLIEQLHRKLAIGSGLAMAGPLRVVSAISRACSLPRSNLFKAAGALMPSLPSAQSDENS